MNILRYPPFYSTHRPIAPGEAASMQEIVLDPRSDLDSRWSAGIWDGLEITELEVIPCAMGASDARHVFEIIVEKVKVVR